MILLVYIFFVLQGVAFYTLLERHLLGLTQNRFGPKKTSYYGLLQPIIDGLKLIKKEQILTFNVTPSFFLGVVVGSFSVIYVEFLCLPYYYRFTTIYWSYLILAVLVGVNIYFILIGSIFRKSKYSYLGGIRAAAASVSYEVVFTLNMVVFILFSKSYTILPLENLGILLILGTFFICVLVELGRTPFDYVESESELVSGFNTEYSRVGFVLIFLKEYGRLLFFSLMIREIFFGGWFIFSILIFRLFIFIRRSFPRLRYDKLIGLMWLILFFHISLALWCTYYLLLF